MGNYGQGWVNWFNNLKETETKFGPQRVEGATQMVSGVIERDAGKVFKGAKTAWSASYPVFKARYIDFFKALFNHPGWYKYHGELHLPTVNKSTPFDIKSLRRLLNAYTSGGVTKIVGPGLASGHVIQCNFTVQDFSSEESWDLALAEAFRINRLLLRSNLIYTLEDFKEYIRLCILVMLKAKQIERTIGWYNTVRGDIPELQAAITHVSADMMENGQVDAVPIQMIQDDKIAQTLTAYERLRSMIALLQVPPKLAEFISYYAGSVFTDQAAANPNLYVPMIRNIPLYSENGQIGIWNIETSDINDVIAEVKYIFNTFSIEAADIMRIQAFVPCELVPYGLYNPVIIEDPGFFTVLINSYTLTKDDYSVFCMSNSGTLGISNNANFLRCDILPAVEGEHQIVLANALGEFSGVNTILRLESQAIYLNATQENIIPKSKVKASIANSGTLDVFSTFVPYNNEGVFIQFGTVVDGETKCVATATSAVTSMLVDINHRAPNLIPGQTMSKLDVTISAFLGDKAYAIVEDGAPTNSANWVMAKIAEDARYVYYLSPDLADLLDTDFTNLSLMMYDKQYQSLTDVGSFAATGVVQSNFGQGKVLIIDPATTANITSLGVIMYFMQAYGSGTTIQSDPYIQFTLYVTNTSADTIDVTTYNGSLLAWFVENVDYHLPIIFKSETSFYFDSSDHTKYAKVQNPVTLLKELYVPVLINDIDIKNTLYWMYLGLFSVYDSIESRADQGSKKHSRKKRGKGKRGKSKEEASEDAK